MSRENESIDVERGFVSELWTYCLVIIGFVAIAGIFVLVVAYPILRLVLETVTLGYYKTVSPIIEASIVFTENYWIVYLILAVPIFLGIQGIYSLVKNWRKIPSISIKLFSLVMYVLGILMFATFIVSFHQWFTLVGTKAINCITIQNTNATIAIVNKQCLYKTGIVQAIKQFYHVS